jgi:hypothetical protein
MAARTLPTLRTPTSSSSLSSTATTATEITTGSNPIQEANEVLTRAARSALRSLPCWLGKSPSLHYNGII